MSMNPNVQNGKMTEAEAFAEYIASFEPDFMDRQKNEKDSRVSMPVFKVHLLKLVTSTDTTMLTPCYS